jgi:uncharacterized protein (TIGR02145 family)
MKKIILIIFSILAILKQDFSQECVNLVVTWTCGMPLNDCRNTETYATIQIGTQCWMAENLNVGTMINSSVTMTNNDLIERYCQNNNTANCDTYGGLYTWNEMMQYTTVNGTRGICPIGWHLPTDAQWCTVTIAHGWPTNCSLTSYQGVSALAGTKMKSTTLWTSGTTGTNLLGFNAKPASSGRYTDGSFGGDMGSISVMWSSTQIDSGTAWLRLLYCTNTGISRDSQDKAYGFSVRCIKD